MMDYKEYLRGLKLNERPDGRSLLLGGIAGGVACGGVSYWLSHLAERRRFNARLNEEVAAVKAHYNERLKEQISEFISEIPEAAGPFVGRPIRPDAGESGDPVYGEATVGALVEKFRLPQPSDPLEGLDDGDDDSAADDEEAGGGDSDQSDLPTTGGSLPQNSLIGLPRDINKPYLISAEEFSETPPGWQALTITYYAGDKILADDKDQPIRDIVKTVGPLTPIGFGGVSGDPHLRYVRNQQLEIDFEIVLDHRSYMDVILNYGNPNRE